RSHSHSSLLRLLLCARLANAYAVRRLAIERHLGREKLDPGADPIISLARVGDVCDGIKVRTVEDQWLVLLGEVHDDFRLLLTVEALDPFKLRQLDRYDGGTVAKIGGFQILAWKRVRCCDHVVILLGSGHPVTATGSYSSLGRISEMRS